MILSQSWTPGLKMILASMKILKFFTVCDEQLWFDFNNLFRNVALIWLITNFPMLGLCFIIWSQPWPINKIWIPNVRNLSGKFKNYLFGVVSSKHTQHYVFGYLLVVFSTTPVWCLVHVGCLSVGDSNCTPTTTIITTICFHNSWIMCSWCWIFFWLGLELHCHKQDTY